MKRIITKELCNGVKIPCIGLGTASLSPLNMELSIEAAFSNGCTLIDTGNAYKSESYIGKAIQNLNKKGVLKREDLFLSSKVGDKLNEKSRPIGYYFYNSPSTPCHDTKKVVYEQVEQSLKKLDTDYIDLMLIHWPYYDVLNNIWKSLEELYEQKVLRAIGVSNCKKRHLERIMRNANYAPMVNQFNISPINTCYEDYDFCNKNNIVMEAYSPLFTLKSPFKGKYAGELDKISSLYNKTEAQIILRWFYQKGIIPIPKSSNPSRIKENLDIFDFVLKDSDVQCMDSFNEDYNYLVESIFCPGY